jgi:hypothetical protein
MSGYEVASFDELESIPVAEGLVWHPIRRRFDVSAFGINAYTAEQVGDFVVERHTEEQLGHEEVYVVVNGRARFKLNDDELVAPAGTMVFIRDPAIQREAIAEEPGTLVLAVGGKPGAPYETSAWETVFYAIPAVRDERWDEAISLYQEALVARSTTSRAPRAAPGGWTKRCSTCSKRSRSSRTEPVTPRPSPTSTRSALCPASPDAKGASKSRRAA